MNKKELITALSQKLNRKPSDVTNTFDTVIEHIAASLKNGETVKLHGFGKFVARTYGERRCYNPVTGKEIILSSSVQPAFIPSEKFRSKIKKQ